MVKVVILTDAECSAIRKWGLALYVTQEGEIAKRIVGRIDRASYISGRIVTVLAELGIEPRRKKAKRKT